VTATRRWRFAARSPWPVPNGFASSALLSDKKVSF
jgi:hypothetical protein